MTIGKVSFLWCALASLAIIVAAYLAGQWFLQQQQVQQQQLNRLEAQRIAAQVHATIQAYRARAGILASDPSLIGPLSANVDTALQQAEQRLHQLVPEAIRIRLIKSGVDQLEAGDYPALSFADIDLLGFAEIQGKPPSIEAHTLGTPIQHFDVVTPIFDSSRNFLGSLLLSFPAGKITSMLTKVDMPEGFAELVQHGNDPVGTSLAVKGDASLKGATMVASVPVGGTRWSVDYYAAVDPAMVHAGLIYIYGGGAMLVLVMIIISVLFVRILMAAIRSDQKTLHTLVLEKWSKHARSHYPVRFKPYQDLAHFILNMGDPAPTRTAAKKQAQPQTLKKGLDIKQQQGDLLDKPHKASTIQQQQPPVRKTVPASIFKAYDIRGIVGDTLTDELVYEIGLAIGSEAERIQQQTIVVARDGRLSGKGFSAVLAKGLRDSGRDVIDIGMVPTPVLYFATYQLKTGSGVIVTGSHNPPTYNGFKIMLGGKTLSGPMIQALRKRIEGGRYSRGEGTYKSHDIVADYIARITADITLQRPIRVVVDCGNGVAGAVAPQLLRDLGCEVHELFCEVDGKFPNHHPDPSKPENLKDLVSEVMEQDADVGLAFDGDGDRLGVIDSKGEVIWPDRQMMLYATDVLSRNPGAEIIYDVKCSSHLAEVITREGGKPLMWKTGHSLIKAKLQETGDLLAGEMSGHIFFKERWYGFDDGLYTAARLLEILAKDPRSSGEIFGALPNAVNTPELNITMAEDEHLEFINNLIAAAHFPGARITTIDGIRADFEDGWGLVRASNTTPCLVLRFEAQNSQALKRIQDQFKQAMLKLKPEMTFPF